MRRKPLRILHLCSECVPFVKSGGLADVVGSLAPALVARGHQVFVCLPKFRDIPDRYLAGMRFVCHFDVYLSWRKQYVGVFELVHQGVTYYFIDNEFYFGRHGLYGFGDDGERFGFLTLAAMELIARLQLDLNIVHVHDWHVAMASVLYHEKYVHFDFYQGLHFILTIHNPAYQGNYDRRILGSVFGLGEDSYERGLTRFGDGVGYLKSGIVYSDFITTVSPTHANELLSGLYSYDLEGVLASRRDHFVGILNGIDEEAYDPLTDDSIVATYSLRNVRGGKAKNKTGLQVSVGLPVRKVPVFTFISRLTWQKGVDILLGALERLVDEDIQVVLIGNGDHHYEEKIQALRDRHSDKVACYIGFNSALARQAYAGADFLVMPSLFEPCGLNQMIALRYGTIPIVRECGGLKDSVIPYNYETQQGNGFSFARYDVDDLEAALRRALALWHQAPQFRSLISQAMRTRLGWSKSAKLYLDLYYRTQS